MSLGWSLYTGSTVHQLLQCVTWVVFIYRLHCTSTTTKCPLGGLYIQVPLYINYYNVSLGWSLYTGYTIHQLLQCVPWVVFIYRFHCTSTTTACPLGGLYNTGSTVYTIAVSSQIPLLTAAIQLACHVGSPHSNIDIHYSIC